MNSHVAAPSAHTSAHILEFEALRDLLRSYTSSPLGGERVSTLAPRSIGQPSNNSKKLTGEIREFRRVGGRFEFSGLLDVAPLLEKIPPLPARARGIEIRDIILVVDRAAEWGQMR